MGRIVQKFGGSSVEDAESIKRVARRIARTRGEGHDVIIVISAMGDTTDELMDLALQVSPRPKSRETTAPARQRNVVAELADGALDRQGDRGFHANRSQGTPNVWYRVLSGRLYRSAPDCGNKCSQWNI